MNRHLTCAAAAALILLAGASSASAQFGGLKGLKAMALPNGGGGGGDIDAFLVSTQRGEDLTRVSSLALLEAVSSHEEAQKLRDTMQAAQALPDPKEREAALRQVTSDAAAKLAAVDFETKSKDLERTASAEQRKQVGVSVYNLALAILIDHQAVEQAHGITQSAASNPIGMATQGAKLLKVKDAAASIGGQMTNLAKISTGLPKLMSVAKLTALPTSTADQPKSAAD
jgi:hypothetical protein